MVVIKVMVEVVKIILVYVPQYCLDDNQKYHFHDRLTNFGITFE